MGGGFLNLEILREGGVKQFWKSRWKGGGQKTMPSVVDIWIFSGITQLQGTGKTRQINAWNFSGVVLF